MNTFALTITLIAGFLLYKGVRGIIRDMENEDSWKTVGLMCWIALSFGAFMGGVTSIWN